MFQKYIFVTPTATNEMKRKEGNRNYIQAKGPKGKVRGVTN